MGEEGEIWNAVRESARIHKENNRDELAPFLENLMKTGRAIRITPYQYRIEGLYDIYPSNKKYHILKTEERGQFRNLEMFLNKLTSRNKK